MNPKSRPLDEREQEIAQVAGTLPEDSAELLAMAVDIVAEINAQIIAGNIEAMAEAAEQYEAIVWKLNGGTLFGTHKGPDAAGSIVKKHCAASPGTAPKWGQVGEFIVTVNGMQARVEVNSTPGHMPPHFAFHIVDENRPFISDTGYRSYFAGVYPGHTVEDAVKAAFLILQTEHRPQMIKPEYRKWAKLPEWVADQMQDLEREPVADEEGQLGFAF